MLLTKVLHKNIKEFGSSNTVILDTLLFNAVYDNCKNYHKNIKSIKDAYSKPLNKDFKYLEEFENSISEQ